ncbi:MAG: c-type cytochrome [Bacteriovoracaceae bacterium]
MKKLFWLLQLFSLSVLGQTYQGVVTKIENNDVYFRDGAKDVILDQTKLDETSLNKIKSKTATSKIFSITPPNDSIKMVAEVPLGIRPDCSELPYSVEDLVSIANDKSVTDINGFLEKIPQGAMQSFTLVANSLSAQKGEGDSRVRPEYPRVLRTTMDGKVTMSYTCDPKSETYGNVEIIYFDDASKKLKTMSLKINAAQGEGSGKRVERNPESCLKCHSNGKVNEEPFIKYNWQEYFVWGDCKENRSTVVYGMDDDGMKQNEVRYRKSSHRDLAPKDCNKADNKAAHNRQIEQYKNFRIQQKDNPCYSQLPWPKQQNPQLKNELGLGYNDYSMYPYAAGSPQTFYTSQKDKRYILDYRQRTNLRFNDTYGHLLSKSIAGAISKNPNYAKVKNILLQQLLGCISARKGKKEIQKYLPDFKLLSHKGHKYDEASGSRLLFSFGAYAGLQPGDWTMNFGNKDVSSYRAAIANQRNIIGDLQITDVVAGELLAEAGKNDLELQKLAPNGFTSKGVEDFFGKSFSCLDELGGGIKAEVKKQEMCYLLEERQKKVIANKNDCVECDNNDLEKNTNQKETKLYSNFLKSMKEIKDQSFKDSVKRGETLLHNKEFGCISCHSYSNKSDITRSDPYAFIPNKDTDTKVQEASSKIWVDRNKDPAFFAQIKDKILVTKSMPYVGGEKLSQQDREDLVNYLENMKNQLD